MYSNTGPRVLLLLAAWLSPPAAGDLCRRSPNITINRHRNFASEFRINGTYTQRNVYAAEYLYGEDFVINCTSLNNRLELNINGTSLQVKEVNRTTVRFNTREQNVGNNIYTCIDRDTGCEESVIISVTPTISINSSEFVPNIFNHYYFVSIGNDYDVFCTGNIVEDLFIHRVNNFTKLPIEVINSTTIKYKPTYRPLGKYIGDVSYQCRVNGTYLSHTAVVKVDYYPKSHDFWCIIVHHQLQCDWYYHTDIGVVYTFIITYSYNEDEVEVLLQKRNAANLHNTLKWIIDIELTWEGKRNITLILETCNSLICRNETHTFNIYALTKKDPVEILPSLRTSSHDAVIRWTGAYLGEPKQKYCQTCVYKINYRLRSAYAKLRSVDESSVSCGVRGICEYTIALPFPDTEYEVQVFTRFKEATDDRMWSEPASVTVRTEPSLPCACHSLSRTAAEVTTPETVLCEVCRLREHVVKYYSAVEEFANRRNYKMDDIKAHRALLSEIKRFKLRHLADSG